MVPLPNIAQGFIFIFMIHNILIFDSILYNITVDFYDTRLFYVSIKVPKYRTKYKTEN